MFPKDEGTDIDYLPGYLFDCAILGMCLLVFLINFKLLKSHRLNKE